MQALLEKFGRVVVPLVTPFDNEERVNTQAFSDLVNYIIEKDYAESLIVAGSCSGYLSHPPVAIT